MLVARIAKLEFSERWRELNIITPELLNEFQKQFESGEDKHPEHYRWRAFVRFLELNPVLPAETLSSLFTPGEQDPDESMGGAMMRELLDRKDCPVELIERSLTSGRAFLVKAAQWAVLRREKNK